jgi:hypothetical protein
VLRDLEGDDGYSKIRSAKRRGLFAAPTGAMPAVSPLAPREEGIANSWKRERSFLSAGNASGFDAAEPGAAAGDGCGNPFKSHVPFDAAA